MTVLRFAWRLTRPWLAPLALPPLLAAWVVLALVVAVLTAWEQAKA